MKLEFPQIAHPIDYSPKAILSLTDYRIEPKWDGIRLIAIKDDAGTRFITRSGRDITLKLEYLKKEFDAVPSGTILDGELTLSMNGSREELGNIQKVIGSTPERANKIIDEIGKPIYNVFDTLWFENEYRADQPLRDRIWQLEEIAFVSDHIKTVEEIRTADIEAAFKGFTGRGGEGIVIKDLRKPYDQSYWLRWKAVKTIDLVVLDFNPPSGRYKDKPMVGSLQGYLYDKESQTFKRAASIYGLSDREREQFYKLFTENPQMQIVVECKYAHRFPSGGFRFCSFLRVRNDKMPQECAI